MLTLNIPSDAVPAWGVGNLCPASRLRLPRWLSLRRRTSKATAPAGRGRNQARGVSVFAGYRNLPDQTAQAPAPTVGSTGDLGLPG
jgi:long-subunit acyl-CoA synthetase (AMP-forming)